MSIVIDVLFVAMLLGFVAAGLRFGLVRSLLGFVFSVASLIGSVVLGNLVAGWLYTGVFRGPMVDQISRVVSEHGGVLQTQTESAVSALPGFVGNALENLGVSTRQVGQAVAASADPLAESVADYVSPVVIHLTALILTLLFFAALRTGGFFVIRLTDRFFRLPILRTLNRIGGGAFGLLKGVLVGLLLATVMLVITPLFQPETAGQIGTVIEKSYVCRWVYELNPVRHWFTADW